MNLLCFVVPLYDGVLMKNNDTDVNILLTPDSSICADGIKIVSKPTVICNSIIPRLREGCNYRHNFVQTPVPCRTFRSAAEI